MTTTPAGRPEPEQAMLKALEDIAPAGPWGSSSRSTIEVLESEDWARVTINVNASKLIGPKVKRYLLAMAPDNVRALVESTASLRAENERLRAKAEVEASAMREENDRLQENCTRTRQAYQALQASTGRRIAELEAEQVALRRHLKAFADAKYMQGIERLRTDECKGVEHKLKHGTFGTEEMEAHKIANEAFGAHFGIYAALQTWVAFASSTLQPEMGKGV